MHRGPVIAEPATQLGLGPDPGRRGDWQRADRAGERAAGEHLDAVPDQAPVLADRRAAGAPELDVGLAAIAGVWSDFEGQCIR